MTLNRNLRHWIYLFEVLVNGHFLYRFRKYFNFCNRYPSSICFVFLGEFGYELLNWQGKIRNFILENPSIKVTVVSRQSCKALYSDTVNFIPLEIFTIWRRSIADGYFARMPEVEPNSISDRLGTHRLHTQIRRYINKSHSRSMRIRKWVWSDGYRRIGPFEFGANRFLYGRDLSHASIYGAINLDHNSPQLEIGKFSDEIQTNPRLEDSILVMRAGRDRIVRSADLIDTNRLLHEIAKIQPIILGEFVSERNLDTSGEFEVNNFQIIKFFQLQDQLNAISRARLCFFLTEGDLRSHTYLPPLVGKNVLVYGHDDLFPMQVIDYWNEKIFLGTGKMIPIQASTIEKNHEENWPRVASLIEKYFSESVTS